MDPGISEALIRAIGTVLGAGLGAGVTAFAPAIKVVLTGTVWANSDLIGEWKGKWVGESGIEIDDKIEISRVWGEKLDAKGINTEFGDYKITGRVSRSNLATCHWEGVKERKPLGGVVIMKLNDTRNELKGYWFEYGREGEFVGGSAEWIKAS